MADKTTRLLMQWAVEGEKKVEASLDLVTSNAQAVQEALKLVGTTASSSFTSVARGAGEAEKALDAALKKALEYEESLKRAGGIPLAPTQMTGLAAHDARAQESLGSGLHQRSGLARIGSELRQLPSIGIPGTGFGTDAIANILRVGGAIQELAPAFGALLPVISGIAIGVGTVTAAFILLSKANEESARVTRALMNSTQEYFRLLQTGTQDQVQDALERAELERDIAQAQIDFNKSILEQIDTNTGTLGRAVADIFNLSGAKELREQTQGLEGQLLQTNIQIGLMTNALNSAEVAAATFAAEFEKFNPTGGERFRQTEDIQRDAFVEYATMADEFTRKLNQAIEETGSVFEGTLQFTAENLEMYQQQRDSYLAQRDAIEAELDYLNQNKGYYEALLQSSDETLRTEAAVQLQRINELEERLNALNTTILPVIEQIVAGLEGQDRAAAIVAEGIQNFFGGLEAFGERATATAGAAVDVVTALDALNDAYDEHAQKLADIEQRFADAQADAAYNRDRALEDALYNAEQRRNDITEEAAEARVKLEEDTERKRNEIERRFNRAYLDAVGDRDALAAYQAQQRRADELADLEAGYDDQQTTIQRRLEDQRRTIDRNLQDQQRTIERRYEDQLRTAYLAYQRALQAEAQRWNAELALRQAAYQQASQNLANALAAELAIQNQAYSQGLVSAAAFRDGLISIFTGNIGTAAAQLATGLGSAITSSGTSSSSSSSSGSGLSFLTNFASSIGSAFGNVLGRASGGRFSAFQMMRVGENGAETVMFDRSGYVANASSTRQMMRGGSGNQNSVTVNLGEGTVRAESRRQAVRYIDEWLASQGVE